MRRPDSDRQTEEQTVMAAEFGAFGSRHAGDDQLQALGQPTESGLWYPLLSKKRILVQLLKVSRIQ